MRESTHLKQRLDVTEEWASVSRFNIAKWAGIWPLAGWHHQGPGIQDANVAAVEIPSLTTIVANEDVDLDTGNLHKSLKKTDKTAIGYSSLNRTSTSIRAVHKKACTK